MYSNHKWENLHFDLVLHPPVNAVVRVVFDEYTLSKAFDRLGDDIILATLVVGTQFLGESLSSLLSVVVGKSRKQVVANVGILDMMESRIEEPSKATVDSGELPAQPVPLFIGVVGGILL